jgi:HEAT repeat protein
MAGRAVAVFTLGLSAFLLPSPAPHLGWATQEALPAERRETLFLNQSQAAWLRELSSADASRRQAASFSLAYFPEIPPPVVAGLVAALSDDDRFVRETAAQSLAELGPAAGNYAAAVWRRLEIEMEPAVLRALLAALARQAPWSSPAASAIRKKALDPDPLVRQAAAAALRALGPAAGVESIPTWRRLGSDPDVHVRLEAARAIGLVPMSTADAEAILRNLLSSEEPWLLREGVTILPRLGPSVAQRLTADLERRAAEWPNHDPRRSILGLLQRRQINRAPDVRQGHQSELAPEELAARWAQRGPALRNLLNTTGILTAEDEEWLMMLIRAGGDARLQPALAEIARWEEVPHLAAAAKARLQP